MSFPRIGLALLVLATATLIQCSSKKSNYLLNYLNAHYKNKLDVRALMGNDRPIIGFIIKNDKALLTVTTPPGGPHDSTFFVIIDIPQKKIINTIKSPYEPYYHVCADINGDSVFCFGNLNPNKNHIINIQNGQSGEFNITDTCISLPGEIIAFEKYILHFASLYGASSTNLTTGKTILFENRSVSNQYAISLPFSNTINLISCKTFGNDSITLIALDQMGKEVWNSKIKILDDLRFNVEPTQIFRTGKYFIVRNSSQLLALDAVSGKRIWDKTFLPYTTHALLWNEKILLFTVIKPEAFSSDEASLQMNLKLIEPTTANELWNKDYKGFHNSSSVIRNELLITAGNSLKVLNEKGEIKIDTVIQNEYTQLQADKLTGKNYALYNGEILYW